MFLKRFDDKLLERHFLNIGMSLPRMMRNGSEAGINAGYRHDIFRFHRLNAEVNLFDLRLLRLNLRASVFKARPQVSPTRAENAERISFHGNGGMNDSALRCKAPLSTTLTQSFGLHLFYMRQRDNREVERPL